MTSVILRTSLRNGHGANEEITYSNLFASIILKTSVDVKNSFNTKFRAKRFAKYEALKYIVFFQCFLVLIFRQEERLSQCS